MSIIVETERLILRSWETEDVDAYYHMNQDLKVIEFLGGSLSMQEVLDFIKAANSHQERHGYTLWAAQLKQGNFIGFIGLNYTDWNTNFTPAVEVGWRLASPYWGQGLATEGASAALQFGFETIKLDKIISFTVPQNIRSLRVMEKLGLRYVLKFSHPKLPGDHRLSGHVLYEITKEQYSSAKPKFGK